MGRMRIQYGIIAIVIMSTLTFGGCYFTEKQIDPIKYANENITLKVKYIKSKISSDQTQIDVIFKITIYNKGSHWFEINGYKIYFLDGKGKVLHVENSSKETAKLLPKERKTIPIYMEFIGIEKVKKIKPIKNVNVDILYGEVGIKIP